MRKASIQKVPFQRASGWCEDAWEMSHSTFLAAGDESEGSTFISN